jgi:hypothetical protein
MCAEGCEKKSYEKEKIERKELVAYIVHCTYLTGHVMSKTNEHNGAETKRPSNCSH